MLTPDQHNVIAVDELYDALAVATEAIEECAQILKDANLLRAYEHVMKRAREANTVLETYAAFNDDDDVDEEEIDAAAERPAEDKPVDDEKDIVG